MSKRMIVVGVRMTPEEVKRLDEVARATRRSRSDLIRALVAGARPTPGFGVFSDIEQEVRSV